MSPPLCINAIDLEEKMDEHDSSQNKSFQVKTPKGNFIFVSEELSPNIKLVPFEERDAKHASYKTGFDDDNHLDEDEILIEVFGKLYGEYLKDKLGHTPTVKERLTDLEDTFGNLQTALENDPEYLMGKALATQGLTRSLQGEDNLTEVKPLERKENVIKGPFVISNGHIIRLSNQEEDRN